MEKWKIILIIITLAILVRLIGINYFPVGDENLWILHVRALKEGINPLYIPHPPLPSLLYTLSSTFLGHSYAFAFRIVPFLAGILILYTIYLMAKEVYNEKIALISLFTSSFLLYTVWNSLYIDMEGGILTLFFMLSLYYFIKFMKTKKDKFLLYSSAFIGLSLLCKYTSLFLIPFFAFFYWKENGSVKKKHLLYLLVPFVIFSFFPILDYVIENSSLFIMTLSWGGGQGIGIIWSNFMISVLKQIFVFPQYATPLLALIPLVYLLNMKNLEDKERILLLWFIYFFIIHFFVGVQGNTQRYLSVIVPPMIILGSKYVYDNSKKLKINFRDVGYLSLFVIIFIVTLYYMNFFGVNEIFSTQNLNYGLTMQNPYFVYWGSVTTLYLMRIFTYLLPLIATPILLIIFHYGSKSSGSKYLKFIFIIVLSLNISYNAVVLKESFFPTVGYNYSGTFYGIVGYYEGINKDVYTTNHKPFATILGGRVKYLEENERLNASFNLLAQRSLVNMKKSLAQEDISAIERYDCKISKTFYSNGFEFAYDYRCNE